MCSYFAEDVHYYGQLAAANDCLYRYMYTSQYIAFIDLDELIVPRGNLTTWGQLFDQLEHQVALEGLQKQICSFSFRKYKFLMPQDETLKDVNGNARRTMESWQEILGSVVNPKLIPLVTSHDIKSLMSYAKYTYSHGGIEKFLVVPTRTNSVEVHRVWHPLQNEKTFEVDEDLALTHHYRIPIAEPFERPSLKNLYHSPEYTVTTDTTMTKYTGVLVNRIVKFRSQFERWKARGSK